MKRIFGAALIVFTLVYGASAEYGLWVTQ